MTIYDEMLILNPNSFIQSKMTRGYLSLDHRHRRYPHIHSVRLTW